MASISSITSGDIADWLATLQLDRYTDKFLQRGYTSLLECPDLTDEHLKAMGIELLGHRKRILHRFPTAKEQALLIARVKTPETEVPPLLPPKERKRSKSPEWDDILGCGSSSALNRVSVNASYECIYGNDWKPTGAKPKRFPQIHMQNMADSVNEQHYINNVFASDDAAVHDSEHDIDETVAPSDSLQSSGEHSYENVSTLYENTDQCRAGSVSSLQEASQNAVPTKPARKPVPKPRTSLGGKSKSICGVLREEDSVDVAIEVPVPLENETLKPNPLAEHASVPSQQNHSDVSSDEHCSSNLTYENAQELKNERPFCVLGENESSTDHDFPLTSDDNIDVGGREIVIAETYQLSPSVRVNQDCFPYSQILHALPNNVDIEQQESEEEGYLSEKTNSDFEMSPPKIPPPPLQTKTNGRTDLSRIPAVPMRQSVITPAASNVAPPIPPRPSNHNAELELLLKTESGLCDVEVKDGTLGLGITPDDDTRMLFRKDKPAPVRHVSSGQLKEATAEAINKSNLKESSKPMEHEVKDASKKVIAPRTKGKRSQRQKKQVPMDFARGSVPHSDYLHKTGSNQKEFCKRYVTTTTNMLSYYEEGKGGTRTLKKSIPFGDVVSILSLEDEERAGRRCCFELITKNKNGTRTYLFSADSEEKRSTWMKILSQNAVPLSLESNLCVGIESFTRAGYMFAQEGISGDPRLVWVELRRKELFWGGLYDVKMDAIDLRKISQININLNDGQDNPVVVIVSPGRSFHLQGDTKRETMAWYEAIKKSASAIGRNLEDQHLTENDVPTVVARCIDFVANYGLTTEGIYRHSAQESVVKNLLQSFLADAGNVFLKTGEGYNEHDIANVLKRYFRTCLNEPLMCHDRYGPWIHASESSNTTIKLNTYKSILKDLPVVNYQTLKVLMGHLKSVASYSDKNQMSATNLCMVFSQSMFYSFEEDEDRSYNPVGQEIRVLEDLIIHYNYLFDVAESDQAKKEKLMNEKKKHILHLSQRKPAMSSNDNLKIPFCINGESYLIEVSSSTTAQGVIEKAVAQNFLVGDATVWAVYEVICNDELERPLHYSELVRDVALKLQKFPCRDKNSLHIKKNTLYTSSLKIVDEPTSHFSTIHYCDKKSFRSASATFENAKLIIFKGTKQAVKNKDRDKDKLGSWNIEDIKWYMGVEHSRNPKTNFGITFIELDLLKRENWEPDWNKEQFGRVICLDTAAERDKWMAVMLLGQYRNAQHLMPQPSLINFF